MPSSGLGVTRWSSRFSSLMRMLYEIERDLAWARHLIRGLPRQSMTGRTDEVHRVRSKAQVFRSENRNRGVSQFGG
jgi:hypothetical protein